VPRVGDAGETDSDCDALQSEKKKVMTHSGVFPLSRQVNGELWMVNEPQSEEVKK
jgi:hypothetical protein